MTTRRRLLRRPISGLLLVPSILLLFFVSFQSQSARLDAFLSDLRPSPFAPNATATRNHSSAAAAAAATTTTSATEDAFRALIQQAGLEDTRIKIPLRNDEKLAACLMVKDDNEVLYEWIAYHYTMMPLRYLVVLNDSGSTQDPRDVLNRWNATKTGLEYWIWQQEKPPIQQDDPAAAHNELVRRQHTFMRDCSLFLKSINATWVAYIDPDEYILLNHINDEDAPFDQSHLQTAQAFHNATLRDVLQLRKQIRNDWTVYDLLQHAATQLHPKTNCHLLSRVRFGSLETENCTFANHHSRLQDTKKIFLQQHEQDEEEKTNNTLLFPTILYRRMYSLRFQQRALLNNFDLNRWGKGLLNLNAMTRQRLRQGIKSPHRPYAPECPRPIQAPSEALFLLAHYSGDWAVHNSRSDARRSRDGYDKAATVQQANVCYMNMQDWFLRFVQQMGWGKTQFLLGANVTTI